MKEIWKRLTSAVVSMAMICGVLGLLPNSNLRLAEPIVAEASQVDDVLSVARTKLNWTSYSGLCLQFVQDVFAEAGINTERKRAARDARDAWQISTDRNIPAGAVVFFDNEFGIEYWNTSVNGPFPYYGHIEISAGGDRIIGSGNGTIQERSMNSYYWQHYTGWGWLGGIELTSSDPDPRPIGYEMSESEAAGQKIPDGDYWIMSRVKPLYRLDINGSTVDIENGTNLEMCHNGFDDVTDVFSVEYLHNGFYKIKQYNSKYVIEVLNADKHREANVNMYLDNGSIAQQWSIEPTQEGYKIRSRANAYYMDIFNGNFVTAESTKNGDNVMTYDFNGNESLFTFIPYSEKSIIQDGLYSFSSAVGGYADAKGTSGEYQAGANVQLGDEKKYVTFRIENTDQGYCKIYDASTGLALQSANGYDGNYISTDCNFTLEKPDNSIRQLWTFRSAGDGKYYIISKLNGHYMDNADAKTTIGNNIRSVVYNGTPATKWTITPVKSVITPELQGDVNDDGKISVEDAQLALLEYVNAMTGLESSLTDKQKLAADVNGDKEISVEDAQTILLYYVSNTLSGENVTWDDLLGKKPQGQQLPFLVKIKDFILAGTDSVEK